MEILHKKHAVVELLERADVLVDGQRPWDIQVHDARLFNRLLEDGSIGLGQSYMDGWWDCEALDQCVDRILRKRLDKVVSGHLPLIWLTMKSRLLNRQSHARADQIGRRHYDLGNDLFGAMLDPWWQYSCAYWEDGDDLCAAQERKLDMICRKLLLEPGMRLLDIGCGWGGLAAWAARRHGVSVVGVTVSDRQLRWGQQHWAGDDVELRHQDYRDIEESFDRIVSVGMLEHVGYKNYHAYMKKLDELLSDDGIALIQTIGSNSDEHHGDPWMERYIFPNSMLPSIAQLGEAMQSHLVMEDLHNLGPHYDRTLLAWHGRFLEAWPDLAGRYGARFRRMWEFYLLSCAGAFRARVNQLWQMVLTPPGRSQPPSRAAGAQARPF
jgi:cyclopropane-fatty-acyl-phospholipid synthase